VASLLANSEVYKWLILRHGFDHAEDGRGTLAEAVAFAQQRDRIVQLWDGNDILRHIILENGEDAL
jgi:hypothetical protein